MIGFLSGTIKSVKNHQLILLTNGVGYTVSVPMNINLTIGQSAELYIHTHVREDSFSLFGFKDEASLDLFEKLLSVSGVGPKSALGIVGAGSAEVIKKAIEGSNLNFFTAISGIGKKSAQKIIIDLKPKLTKIDADLENLDGNSDLSQALTQLGFTKSEILSAIPIIDGLLPLDQQIKEALKILRT